MSLRVLVTGAAGFLGSHIVERLAARDDLEVVATRRRRTANDAGGPAAWVACDLADADAVDSLFGSSRFDAVVHAAAALPDRTGTYLRRAARDNVAATANLAAAAAGGVSWFVYCSTISVYEGAPANAAGFGETDRVAPTSVYGWSKRAGEKVMAMAAREAPLACACLRLAGIHGPGRNSGVVYHMLRSALAGRTIEVAEPDSRFRLVFVDDAARAVEHVLDHPPDHPTEASCRCYNVAGREIVSLRELAAAVRRVAGSSSPIAEAAGAPARNQVMDIARIETELGFEPRPLAENLRVFMEYLQADTT